MATVRNFLGTDIEIPEDRRYSPASHLWFRAVSNAPGADRPGTTAAGTPAEYEVGITEPGIALTGGLVELDVLAEPGAGVMPGDEVAFATTRKAIKFFATPVAGPITTVNAEATAESANASPYDTWLFRTAPAPDTLATTLVDAAAYAAKLATSEHATEHAAAAAAAAKAGKASPTCRSLYAGIKE